MEKEMTNWRKSSYSQDNGCVSFADFGETIGLRDSKDPDGPVLRFTRTEIAALLAGCKAGEFDDLA
jgi:hypothetical protein